MAVAWPWIGAGCGGEVGGTYVQRIDVGQGEDGPDTGTLRDAADATAVGEQRTDAGADAERTPDGRAVDSGGSREDAGPVDDTCAGLANGPWCDGDHLVECEQGRRVGRAPCPHGCEHLRPARTDRCLPAPDGVCGGRGDGAWCVADSVVTCAAGTEAGRQRCEHGCEEEGGAAGCRGGEADGCQGRADGLWCDGDDLVGCSGGRTAERQRCPEGCESMPAGVDDRCRAGGGDEPCVGLQDGLWCDGDDLIRCSASSTVSRQACPSGCESMPAGVNDRCREALGDFCVAVPAQASPHPPDEACNFMDWDLSPDGFYLVSRFGTSNDGTTWGHSTSCGVLQAHYNGRGCRYDNLASVCLPGDHEIPWIQGDVDYDYDTLIRTVDAQLDGDVDRPEYFYVAGAQRFDCGTLLRVSRPATGRCVVAYVEDGGPGERYEEADRGGRRILDSSPAVVRYLGVQRWGWANTETLYVEWGQPGDVPGRACQPCTSTPARAGTEGQRAGYDVNHMMPFSCRE